MSIRFPVSAAILLVAMAASAKDRPNVLVVMVDDLGFSDLGCYGSEIETPNLDRLAANGLRFSQFYNTAKCHSSRISLLTGCYPFQAGNVALSRAVTSAEVLSAAGYFTAMAGKWHLKQEPTDFGFDRYFGHLSGACNYFRGDKTFRLNGEPWAVPETGFYTTVANVDHAIGFLGEARKTGKPWYLYVAFNAPHAPLQALETDYRKYEGKYDVGWDIVREARARRQQELGLFGGKLEPSPRPDHVPAWDVLDESHRRFEGKRMTALAGMIDRVDQELGRLFIDLKRVGEFENTLILFVSDNGACPYDRRSTNIDGIPCGPETSWSDSTGWAWVRNSPFRYYKQNQFEGGISSPAIVHWPAGLKAEPGTIVHEPAHLVDVLPTLVEVCDAPIPETWPGRVLGPLAGVSLAPLLTAGTLGERPPIHLQFSRDRGLRDGRWKAVSFRGEPWELYDMSNDRTELSDLAATYPERLSKMAKRWTELAEKKYHVPENLCREVGSAVKEHVHPEWTDFSKAPGGSRRGGQSATSTAKGPIRARKDTSLTIADNQLVLACTGTDSGIAVDRVVKPLPPGPYTLAFRVRSKAEGNGEVYFTTDAQTKLPDGHHLTFNVIHDDEWHDVSLSLDTAETIFAFRLDPCSAPGEVIVANLQLRGAAGKILAVWPGSSTP